MAWTGLNLTVEGRNALNRAQLSNKICFQSIVVGDGNAPANFSTLKGLVHQLYELKELKIDTTENGCILTADLPRVDYDYYFREIGVIVVTDGGEKLYVYDNCGDDAQYMVNTTGVETTRKRIRLSLIISDVAEITVVTPDILYVDYYEFEKKIRELEIAMGEDQGNLEDHFADRNNPHEVTKEQVGLGESDNTSDMDKPVSRAQQAALDAYYAQSTGYTDTKIAKLINGAPETLDTLGEIAQAMKDNQSVVEALDVAIGKKANEAEFNSHAKDTTVHITSAERNKWNSKAEGSHTHDDRYYTESEINTKLNSKSDSNHTHNYAAASHTHDDRYYTESEINSKLSGKADSGHTHNYLPLTGGDLNGGIALKPLNPGFGWLDLYHAHYITGSNIGHYHNMSLYVNDNDAFVRADRGALYLLVSNTGVGCRDLNNNFCPIYASAFNVNSSRRYKEKIAPVSDDDVRGLLRVEIVSYDYKEGVVGEQSRYGRTGVIAEDVEKVIPEVVSYREIDGKDPVPDSVDYSRFIPYLIRMVQLQQSQMDGMQKEISTLKEDIRALKSGMN